MSGYDKNNLNNGKKAGCRYFSRLPFTGTIVLTRAPGLRGSGLALPSTAYYKAQL